MVAHADADALQAILERQFASLLAVDGPERLFRIPRLLDFIRRDPQLAPLLHDIDGELDAEIAELERLDGDVRAGLIRVFRRHRVALQSSTSAESVDLSAMRRFLRSASAKPEFAFVPNRVELPSSWNTKPLVDSLKGWLTATNQADASNGRTTPRARLRAVGEVELLAARHEQNVRRFQMIARSQSGPALRRLRAHVEQLNPTPPALGDIAGHAAFKRKNKRARTIHHPNAAIRIGATAGVVDALARDAGIDVALLRDELAHRVAVGRSRRALIERYAARCEAFAQDVLRTLAATPKRAEKLLTIDFARWLFDQGLAPIIEPTLGELRPDIVSINAESLFYVEAKQYGGKSPRTKIVDAYKQVWSTWARLRKRYAISEAFLVVFRSGGPLLIQPKPLRVGEFTLYTVVVDLARHDAGSRTKTQPIEIDPVELMPVR